VRVQLVKLANCVPTRGDWFWELKYDGYRMLIFADQGNVKLITRGGHNWTNRFPSVENSVKNWAGERKFILDGELVVVDENGRSDFNALQNFSQNLQNDKLIFVAFDLLLLDNKDLRKYPLKERKEILQNLMRYTPKNLVLSEIISGNARELLNILCKGNYEGLIGKLAYSKYAGKRDGSWIKLKCENYTR